jgi:hypothetical protein
MTLVRILASSASDLQLPALRRAEVKSVSANSIEMTLYCASDGSSDTLTTPVSAELHPSLARELAIRLWLAADQTEDSVK